MESIGGGLRSGIFVGFATFERREATGASVSYFSFTARSNAGQERLDEASQTQSGQGNSDVPFKIPAFLATGIAADLRPKTGVNHSSLGY